MSLFVAIANIYADSDAFFAAAEQKAFNNDDEVAFDIASKARQHNDQAYFLYLFTRLEAEINNAVRRLVQQHTQSALPWEARRVWQAWSRQEIRDIPLLSKAEALTDKSKQDYATIKEYYIGRNAIAHGGQHERRAR